MYDLIRIIHFHKRDFTHFDFGYLNLFHLTKYKKGNKIFVKVLENEQEKFYNIKNYFHLNVSGI